ncbi:hypothetical protein [Paenibacillus sp. FSL R7-0331]|uniref:hypothetical protein n=1 Tax=Paenibacillus sp. FSL R7-0331 TaxID=1536773 RepID=UPI00069334EA|nr:hypothetical protein [Paenibacillus sp. FSL R7-0331]
MNQVGIIAPKPTITQTDKTQGSISTTTSTSQVVLSIGRTEFTVNSKSIETYNKNTGVKTGTANAMLAMNYHVTENEYLFLREMGDENVEKSLYILDAIIANGGKVTKEILNDKTLSVKGVAMIYHMNYELGMTLAQVDQMHQEEVILPKRAEVWGLLGIKALSGGGLSLQKSTVKGKPVETKTVESPKKPVAGGNGGTQGAGKTANIPGVVQNRINIANGPTRFSPSENAGWEHVTDRHLSPGKNAGQFTVSENEVKGILGRKDVIQTPATVLSSGQYSRVVDTGKVVGTVKPSIPDVGGTQTTWIQIITDSRGNLISTYPIPAPK